MDAAPCARGAYLCATALEQGAGCAGFASYWRTHGHGGEWTHLRRHGERADTRI
jgi:hypothetical protein